MTTMKFEDRLDTLDKEIEGIKSCKVALDENNQRFEKLLERMERQLQLHEQSKTKTITNGELLCTHGIMSQPKKVATSYELEGSHIENREEINSTLEGQSQDHNRNFPQ